MNSLSKGPKKDINLLIHDINSSLSALSQALELANDNFDQDKELARKIIKLSRPKMTLLLTNWEKIKIYLKKNN